MRTATARSPTSSNAANKAPLSGITDDEQQQIMAVLSRAETRAAEEQHRLGKLVDRLDKMKTRATGNGVTQCLLCSAEFGLLGSKSYGAMCVDCRKVSETEDERAIRAVRVPEELWN